MGTNGIAFFPWFRYGLLIDVGRNAEGTEPQGALETNTVPIEGALYEERTERRTRRDPHKLTIGHTAGA